MGDSDVEDGMEKFEVTDADLQFTFNTNRRRQTKNQATYGIYLSLLGGGGGDGEGHPLCMSFSLHYPKDKYCIIFYF